MTTNLETARHPETLKRVCIEPLTRVEGHGKVTLLLDEDNHVKQARLHIVEFRGFEKFIQAGPIGSCRCWYSASAGSVRSAIIWLRPRRAIISSVWIG